MASDQGLSIFDEPESADDTAAPGGSTGRGNAGEETQVLPVTPKDEPATQPAQPAQPTPQPAAPAAEATRRSPVVPPAAPRPAVPTQTTTPLPVVRRGGYDKSDAPQADPDEAGQSTDRPPQ